MTVVRLRNEYLGFVWPSIFGMFPNAMWWASALIPFVASGEHSTTPTTPWWMVAAMAAFTLAFLFVILVAPILFPILVLRARQPRGATVECDDEGITERDGPWRRSHIPWSRADVALVRWKVPSRAFRLTHRAVQVRDRDGGDAAITFWSSEPAGATISRRRVYATTDDMKSIEDALAKHELELRALAKKDDDFT